MGCLPVRVCEGGIPQLILAGIFHLISKQLEVLYLSIQISAMDLSAQTTMKSAANCDKQCELQNSEKHQNLERALHSWDIPKSNSASVSPSLLPHPSTLEGVAST